MKTQHQHRQLIRRLVTEQFESILSPDDVHRLIERIVVKDWNGYEGDLGTCLVHVKPSRQPNTTDLSDYYEFPEIILGGLNDQQRNRKEIDCRMTDTDTLILVDGWGRESIYRFMGSPEYPRDELRQTQLTLYCKKLDEQRKQLIWRYIGGHLEEADHEREFDQIKAERERIEALIG